MCLKLYHFWNADDLKRHLEGFHGHHRIVLTEENLDLLRSGGYLGASINGEYTFQVFLLKRGKEDAFSAAVDRAERMEKDHPGGHGRMHDYGGEWRAVNAALRKFAHQPSCHEESE